MAAPTAKVLELQKKSEYLKFLSSFGKKIISLKSKG
jgi:hypothetical protein